MGKDRKIKLFFLGIIFFVTSLFVYSVNFSSPVILSSNLFNFISKIDTYKTIKNNELSVEARNMLKLDDYLFADFKKMNSDIFISLYIGYYFDSGKAYAAHSPLVCYPSQGWKVVGAPKVDSLTVGEHEVEYEELVASFEEKKELVIYWYQSGKFTNTKVYYNKISMGYNKLFNNDTKHGFVRVAVPFEGSGYDEAKKNAIEFINAFYPYFINNILYTPGDKIINKFIN